MELCTVSDMKPQEKPMIGENVSRIIKMLLARDEMRQQDLAEGLGYNAATITRALKGERDWTLNDLVALAEFFEVAVSLFFEDPQHILVRTVKATTTESDDGSGKYLVTERDLVAA